MMIILYSFCETTITLIPKLENTIIGNYRTTSFIIPAQSPPKQTANCIQKHMKIIIHWAQMEFISTKTALF